MEGHLVTARTMKRRLIKCQDPMRIPSILLVIVMPIVCRILSASPSVTAFAPMGTMTRMPFQLRLAKDRPVDREVLAPTVQPKRQKKTTKQTAPYTASSTRVTSGAKPETASKGSKPRTIKNITLSLELDAYFKSKLTEMHERNSQGMNLTQSYCDSVLGLCVAADEWESVLEVMEVMTSQGLEQERSTYRACLKACFEYGNGASSLDILNAMKAAGYVPSVVDVGLVVVAICKQDQKVPQERWLRRALALLKSTAVETEGEGSHGTDDNDTAVVPVEAYDAVLARMVETKNWKDAIRLLNLMEKKGRCHPAPVLSTYRLVIENCVAVGQAEQAFQVLLSMTRQGIAPSVYCFELCISSLARKLQWRRALQLLSLMDDMGVQKTVIIYNVVISACAKSGEVGKAKSLLQQMRKDGIKPDIFSFNSVMTACASTSRWKDALTILDQCHREPGVEPDIITYTNAIRACSRGGKTNQALSILQVIKDRKLPLDIYAYTAAIDACGKAAMWQRSLELLAEMENKGVVPNAVAYSVAITACGNGGQWEKALNLLNEMRQRKMPINLITYNAAITALSKASRRSAKRSTKENVPLRLSNVDGKILDIDEDQLWIRALGLLEQMKKDGLEPDGFSYSAAISCCGTGGRWEEALRLIETMQSGGPKTRPNKISYTAAIAACGRSGRYEEALKLFTDMKEQGLQPDRVAYNALFSALRVADMPEKAIELWREMIGKQSTKSSKIASARADSSLSPDIITVTDIIATLARSEARVQEVDQVFEEAVDRGIVFGKHSLDSHFEVDLSGMTLPVARAAVRFAMKRIKGNYLREKAELEGITFITGVGIAQLGRQKPNIVNESHSVNEQHTPMSLRDYIQSILSSDFFPSIQSNVPSLAQGTVEVTQGELKHWIEGQCTH